MNNVAVLGLAIAAFGCENKEPEPGVEGETGETGDGDGDGETGDGDGDGETGDGDGDGETGDGDGDGETGDGDGDGETGDGDGDDGFALVSAQLDASGQAVVLSFSQAVAPVDEVTPEDFRISVAASIEICHEGEGCVPDETFYWDANYYAVNYINDEFAPDARFEVSSISAGEQATEVILHFGAPLEPALCEYLAEYGEPDLEVLFVHYAPGEIPLQSSGGVSLEAIGADWVEQPGPMWSVEGDFPNLDPKVSIPCN